MKKITILGSTGSIGCQTLEVIDNLLDEWEVKALTAYKNIDFLSQQIEKYQPEFVVVVDEKAAAALKTNLKNKKTEVLSGKESLKTAASVEVDLLLNAVVGFAGLEPSIAAANAGNDIALANKESLVSGGSILTDLVRKKGIKLLPVDSEHNAIFQLLKGHREELDQILLTASGGPFFSYSKDELAGVSVEDALNHPNWEMGSKITIDSASLMNKGLEVIEAHWLFNCDYENIKVLVHPQSIVHSMISLIDGTVLAEMGSADMRMPIQYCLTYPERKQSLGAKLELDKIAALEFFQADTEKFPNLKYAYTAGKVGGTYPAVLNAANEIAVYSFLKGEIPFLALSRVVAAVLDQHQNTVDPSLEAVLNADQEARRLALEVIKEWF
ncbi:1-deoxy-D-xylulose 5-phosphate reductoisomerase [Halanaerobium congolense]|jgi:1-deoxy-D-xylulose-5-phosphate reductoisomerase|uniref:1-deoxy-D-xylulose 5-phosphate reductoisomerase n=1 Tax=Halanaerobium congolense TaxID=54121 RepID=A0A1G6I6N8_9FIRM|nr:1-deoxy-D-xylulose-5-phosphate reductoisomerase [Halanaerobium congolense]PUU92601.1 MAG: 1-deoxy-D-xylulose-5-phosphate reductoisomerase [Halanaerobium sp.]PTX17103.1 1-deoxy-D-xylulose 5-phosphate reductoisomerase [Halanaerobium congolense]PXV69317.1 1-deoxy-D-xylulose 5-phosphate reductoisomerase [Halanaerobium congolense]SDC02111.1 1-deoxy-D-xylulose 5-phosphate reductoisomerase [Halanaerobium congolense]SDE70874.1 1-deoxy-D-xylulose 5-phosphate reductoisomerase [Halanaerobium congolens